MRAVAGFSRQRVRFKDEPWVCFSIFFVWSAILSFFPLSPGVRVLIFLSGAVFLFWWVLSAGPAPEKKKDLFSKEFFPRPPAWVLISLCSFAVGLRFWKLQDFFAWINGDEATIGMLVIDLVKKWNWDFFHGFAQITPPVYWMDFLTYQITGSTLLCLWLPSAVLSAAVIPLAYFATKRLTSRSLALTVAALAAFSYWPLLMGRLALPLFFILLWEGVVFYLLGLFLSPAQKLRKSRLAVLLGLAVGLGLLTSPPHWFVIAVPVILVVFEDTVLKKRWSNFFSFAVCLVVAILPFGLAVIKEGYGRHFLGVSALNIEQDWLRQLSVSLDYWLVLFGSVNNPAGYNSFLGGILNPVLSALFLLGVVEIFRRSDRWLRKWSTIFFLFSLATGFLSHDVDVFRIVQILPLLIMGAAIGARAVFSRSTPRRAVLIGFVLLSCSASLDLYRLIQPYWNISNSPEKFEAVSKSMERYRAYRILETIHQKAGPGLLFMNWIPEYEDESLAVATYPFNAAWNPSVPGKDVQWAAVFTSAHYVPFLASRFRGLKWYFLPAQTSGNYSDHALAVIPITPEIRGQIESWRETNVFFVDLDTRMIRMHHGENKRPLLEDMIREYPKIPNDPFLQSFFLEKLIFCYWKEKVYNPSNSWNQYSNYSSLLKAGLPKSYRDPVLYEKYALLLIAEERYEEAGILLRRILQWNPQNDHVKNDLKLLTGLKIGSIKRGPEGFEPNPAYGGTK